MNCVELTGLTFSFFSFFFFFLLFISLIQIPCMWIWQQSRLMSWCPTKSTYQEVKKIKNIKRKIFSLSLYSLCLCGNEGNYTQRNPATRPPLRNTFDLPIPPLCYRSSRIYLFEYSFISVRVLFKIFNRR